MQPRSIALLRTLHDTSLLAIANTSLEKIDLTVEQVLSKFLDILAITINRQKTREVLAAEAVRMQADAILIVRLCQDLLTVSRSLREIWCLGTLQMDLASSASQEFPTDLALKFDALTSKIAAFEKIDGQ